jgi:hypothetical protein
MTLSLDSLLSSQFTQPTPNIPTGSIQPGYVSSMIDGMTSACKRVQSINSNSLLDCSQLENDPNFQRSNPTNQQNILSNVSKLGISTQTVTASQGLGAMSGVAEIIPANMRSTLMNFMSAGSSAGTKTLQAPSVLTQNTSWESSLSKDLSSLFGTSLSFSQIAAMAAAVGTALLAAPAVANNGATNVLPLTMQQSTPNDITGVVQSTDLQTALSNTALTDTQITDFNTYLTTQLSAYATTTIGSQVSTSNYTGVTVTMDDPLGLGTRSQLQTELQTSYNATLLKIVTNSGIVTNPTDITTITNILVADAQNNLSAGFSGKFALPSMATIVAGVKSVNKNFVIQSFNNAFDNLTVSVISQAGLNQPIDPNVKSFDYLVNIKKNLEARLLLQQTGATQIQLNTYDAFLKTVIASGDVSPAALNQLNDELNSLLKETIEVC